MTTKIEVTPQQRANALEALKVMWPSVPDENVYRELAWWRAGASHGAPDCGTVACFGGWCAWWPAFQAQGIVAHASGAPSTPSGSGTFGTSQFLFGQEDMFAPRDGHPADKTAGGDQYKGSDHALVLRRLRWLIRNSKVVRK